MFVTLPVLNTATLTFLSHCNSALQCSDPTNTLLLLSCIAHSCNSNLSFQTWILLLHSTHRGRPLQILLLLFNEPLVAMLLYYNLHWSWFCLFWPVLSAQYHHGAYYTKSTLRKPLDRIIPGTINGFRLLLCTRENIHTTLFKTGNCAPSSSITLSAWSGLIRSLPHSEGKGAAYLCRTQNTQKAETQRERLCSHLMHSITWEDKLALW